MIPPESDKPETVPALAYHLGGGLFNLLTALAPLPVGFSSAGLYVRTFCILLGSISLALALLNLIPLKMSMPNDGYNVMRIRRSVPDRIAVYNILRINAFADRTPSETPAELYAYSEEGEFSRISKLLAGYRLLDLREFSRAEELFRVCARKDAASFAYYRLEAAAELLFCLILRGAPDAKLAQAYSDELRQYV